MEGRGTEGDEAEMSWGQVMKSLVGLYEKELDSQRKGESLRRSSWEQWDRAQ